MEYIKTSKYRITLIQLCRNFASFIMMVLLSELKIFQNLFESLFNLVMMSNEVNIVTFTQN